MRGEPFKRCGCHDEAGKRLGTKCPRLDERQHGGWYYRYSEPTGAAGRRRQPIAGPFPTKKAADADRVQRLSRLGAGVHALADRTVKVSEDFALWRDSKFYGKRSTQRSTLEIGRLYVEPGLGHLALVDVRAQHLDLLYAAMRQIGRPVEGRPEPTLRRLLEARGAGATSQRPLSISRMHRIHAVIRAYLADRTARGMIPQNPAQHINLGSARAPEALLWTPQRVQRWLETDQRPSPVMVWTPEQTGLFLDFAADDRLYGMWHVISHRGLRRGEACGWDRGDLDLPGFSATVRESLDDSSQDGPVIGTTKNRRSRVMALDEATVEVLAAEAEWQGQNRKELEDAYQDSGLVFTDAVGRSLNPDTVSQHFDRLIARYEAIRRSQEQPRGRGRPTTPETIAASYRMPLAAVQLALAGPPLPPIRLHDLRHVAACLTYRATKDLKLVSRLMGHSGIQITADIYTTLFEEVDRAAAEAVAKIVPRSRKPRRGTASSEG